MDRTTRIVVVSAVALGLALRCWDPAGTSLAQDEAYSVWVVQDGARFAARLPTDGHPPLWYLGLAGWTAVLGPGDVAARASSAVAAAALVPLMAALALRLFDPLTARWSAVLAAIWPLLVIEQREVRMYAWLPVAVVLAALALLRSRGRAGDHVVAGVAVAALASIHHFGAVTAAGLVAATALERRSIRAVLPAAAVALAIWLPLAGQTLAFAGGYAVGGTRGIGPGSYLQLATGLTVGTLERADPAVLISGALVVVSAAAIGLARSGRWRAWLLVVLAFALALPVALAALVFAFPPAPKYFVAAAPVLTLLVGRQLAVTHGPLATLHAIATVAVLAAGALFAISYGRVNDDWRGLAERVERETTDEEAIYVGEAYFQLAFERYYRGPLPVHGMPELGAAPARFPLPSDAEVLAVARGGTAPRWLLAPDWLLDPAPGVRAALARSREIGTGWWMRAFSVPPAP